MFAYFDINLSFIYMNNGKRLTNQEALERIQENMFMIAEVKYYLG